MPIKSKSCLCTQQNLASDKIGFTEECEYYADEIISTFLTYMLFFTNPTGAVYKITGEAFYKAIKLEIAGHNILVNSIVIRLQLQQVFSIVIDVN